MLVAQTKDPTPYEGISQRCLKNWADVADHGLRTPNEGINQRYLKNWANVADKICFGRIFWIGIEFSAVQ